MSDSTETNMRLVGPISLYPFHRKPDLPWKKRTSLPKPRYFCALLPLPLVFVFVSCDRNKAQAASPAVPSPMPQDYLFAMGLQPPSSTTLLILNQILEIWWTRGDSNPRPPRCQRGKQIHKAWCCNHLRLLKVALNGQLGQPGLLDAPFGL
jgi:hypothetical protein